MCLCECQPSAVNLAAAVLSPGLCLQGDHGYDVFVCVFQRRSVNRWRGYAGHPEATCRSSASTSSGDASYASPAA